jgi:ubiquinone/menaquinone biosynthesis C-methylase UbiE
MKAISKNLTSPKRTEQDQMLMNWPERVWIYSPVRVFFLRLHAKRWQQLARGGERTNALEIGCGLGKGARILVEKMGFRKVFAFDIEESLIRRAARNLPSRLVKNISFFVGDAQALPFADSSFDAVVNYGIIHHVLDWRQCIREISRVLRSEGTFYFEEIYPPLYANILLRRLLRHPREDRFDGPQFLEALESCNLKLLKGVRADSRFAIVGAAVKR